MKIYIEYESPIEAQSKLVKVVPRKRAGDVEKVSVIIQGKPTITEGRPYEYEQEIMQMLLHISKQNVDFQKLKEAFDKLYEETPEAERKPLSYYLGEAEGENGEAK